MKNIQTYCISETSDLLNELLDCGFPVERYRAQLKIIGAKARNNKVGFAQFGGGDDRIRLCVCPKIADPNEASLYRYLNVAINIATRYKKGVLKIDDCFFDVALEGGNGINSNHFMSFDEIIDKNVEFVLKSIKEFFINYRAFRFSNRDFKSSSLKYSVNVLKNVFELDRSKIHQTQKERKNESIIADYTIEALNYFIQKKCKHFDDGESLRHKASQISALIRRRYNIKARGVRVSKLMTKPIQRLFYQAGAYELYEVILRLISEFGTKELENHPIRNSKPIADLSSFFMSPELIYQLYVFDKFKRQLSNHEVIHEPNLTYELMGPQSQVVNLRSNPDIVIDKVGVGGSKWIVDVKWKVPKTFSGITFEDIAKLQRDMQVHKADHAALVYPKVSPDLIGKYKINMRKGDTFTFWVIVEPFGGAKF